MSGAITTQGFKLKIGHHGDSPAALVEIKEVKTFTAFDGQAAEIPVTNLQSAAKEVLMGLQDFGQFKADVNHLPSDPGQQEARAAKTSQALMDFVATFSDNSTASFSAYVLSNPITGAVDSVVGGSFVLRISGIVTFA